MITGICYFKSKIILSWNTQEKVYKNTSPFLCQPQLDFANRSQLDFPICKIILRFFFFRKSVPSCGRRPRQPVLCVSPGGTDRLLLLRACDYVQQAVTDALSEVWTPGIQVTFLRARYLRGRLSLCTAKNCAFSANFFFATLWLVTSDKYFPFLRFFFSIARRAKG